MNPQQPKILVLGATGKVGGTVAQLLAESVDVRVVAGVRSPEKAQHLTEQGIQAAQKLEGTVIPVELDISNDSSIESAVATLNQSIDHLDVLINNAGIYPDSNVNILTVDSDSLDSAMNTNTFGTIKMVQAFLPLLEKSQDARVINVSSGMGALDGLTTTAPSYCLSKLALNGATIMLAESLSSKGIVVNSMCPGWVQTDMGGTSAPRTPEQGADTAIWLATEASRIKTGKFWRDREAVAYG